MFLDCEKSVVVLEDLPGNNSPKRGKENFDIERKRSMLQIVKVKFQTAKHLFYRVCIAIIKRSIRGYARLYLIEQSITFVTFHDLLDKIGTLRPWTNKCHVAYKDVPQLR